MSWGGGGEVELLGGGGGGGGEVELLGGGGGEVELLGGGGGGLALALALALAQHGQTCPSTRSTRGIRLSPSSTSPTDIRAHASWLTVVQLSSSSRHPTS